MQTKLLKKVGTAISQLISTITTKIEYPKSTEMKDITKHYLIKQEINLACRTQRDQNQLPSFQHLHQGYQTRNSQA